MRALRVALLLLLVTRLPECETAARSAEGSDEADDADDDSDSAPFMIVVVHEGGALDEASWRCSGSLVSLRTGVTSAECARGQSPEAMPELWALAAATAAGLASRTDGARRISRVATAGATQQATAGGEWSDALLDLAVLELEAPFGSGAHARPILMATAPDECSDNGVCHVVRALAARRESRVRLRIVDATVGDEAPCAQHVREWASMREHALCLTGPELCQSERGAGVVCGGKLCGVVSCSSAEHAPHCGRTHAAQSVARWRRFLHCAHTLRACGRGSCAELCSEQRLLDDGEDASTETERAPGATREPEPEREREHEHEHEHEREHEQQLGEHAAPHVHPVDLDLAHLAPHTYAPERANSTRVAPPTRVRPSAHTQQTSRTRMPAVARASHGRKPTRTAWPSSTSPARRAHPAPPPPPSPPQPFLHQIKSPSPELPAAVALATERRATATASHVTYGMAEDAGGEELPRPRERLSSRKPAPPPSAATRLPAMPSSSSGSVRPTPLFEPNRPDFRAGEYGDNAAEYGAPADDGLAGNVTSTAAPFSGESAPRTRTAATAQLVALTPPPAHHAPPSPAPRPAVLVSRPAKSSVATTCTHWREPTPRARAPPAPAAASYGCGRLSLAQTQRSEVPPSTQSKLLFEPNRPDVQVGAYGDNAAEYAEPDVEGPPLLAAASTLPAPPAAGTLPAPPAAGTLPAPPAAPALRSEPAAPATAPAPPTPSPRPVRLKHANKYRSAASSLRIARTYGTLTFILFYFSNQ